MIGILNTRVTKVVLFNVKFTKNYTEVITEVLLYSSLDYIIYVLLNKSINPIGALIYLQENLVNHFQLVVVSAQHQVLLQSLPSALYYGEVEG